MELAHIPVTFLPLNDEMTLLSKLSEQLQGLDFTVFVCVGPLGYPFGAYQPRVQAKPLPRGDLKPIEVILREMSLDPESSPWTREIHDHAQQYGTVLPMDDPGWCNQHDTFCQGIDRIGGGWDQVLLVCGDTIFSTGLLRGITELPPPCQYQMCHAHSVFLLDRHGRGIYRSYAQGCRKRWVNFRVREAAIAKYPDGRVGTNRLMKLNIEHFGVHNGPQGTWRDVDGPGSYEDARAMVNSGKLA